MTGQSGTIEESFQSFHMKTRRKIGKQTGSLDGLLLGVVDETIRHVFRDAGANVIYKYIENECNLNWEEIAEKPEVFSAGLETLLGSGASVMEKLILKKLYRKLELEYKEKEGYELLDHIKELRKRCNR